MTRRRLVGCSIVLVLAGVVGCQAVLGIGDYTDRAADSGPGANADGPVVGDDAAPDAPDADSATDAGDASDVEVPPPSCVGLPATCGGTNDCCSSSAVPGGTYARTLEEPDAAGPGTAGATLSDFRLDDYEITVGRFRKFVAAYAQAMIPTGAGKNPNNLSDPGWDAAWNGSLPATKAALTTALNCQANFATWTDSVKGNETLPINCITWFEAQAFCTWDGGRLPTEAEWQYAAGGGSENRTYPWGEAPLGSDANLANYGCFYNGNGTCSGLTNIATVGSISAGNGKWGQADMAGNLFEWVQDWYATPYPASCNNCADLSSSPTRVMRGGAFMFEATYVPAAYRNPYRAPSLRYHTGGARCARAPSSQ